MCKFSTIEKKDIEVCATKVFIEDKRHRTQNSTFYVRFQSNFQHKNPDNNLEGGGGGKI